MTDLLDRPLSETWRIWSALLAPPLLWGGRLLATWTVAEVACEGDWAGTTGYFAVQTVITVGAVTVTLASGWAAWTVGRGADDHFDPDRAEAFLAVTGVLAAVLFTLLMLLEGSGVYLIGCR